MAKFIRRRLDALAAAQSLYDFWPPKSKPERVHRLNGRRGFVYSVDLKQPYRLIFSIDVGALATFNDTQENWQNIISIAIDGIEDTHG